MGGYGSGWPWWRPKRKTVESAYGIDADETMLFYKTNIEPEQMAYQVYKYLQWLDMVATLTPLGYRRWWFVCPECGHRRKKLYSGACLALSCRKCMDLTYARCQKNRRPNRFERMVFGSDAALYERCWHWDEKDEAAWIRRQEWRRMKRICH